MEAILPHVDRLLQVLTSKFYTRIFRFLRRFEERATYKIGLYGAKICLAIAMLVELIAYLIFYHESKDTNCDIGPQKCGFLGMKFCGNCAVSIWSLANFLLSLYVSFLYFGVVVHVAQLGRRRWLEYLSREAPYMCPFTHMPAVCRCVSCGIQYTLGSRVGETQGMCYGCLLLDEGIALSAGLLVLGPVMFAVFMAMVNASFGMWAFNIALTLWLQFTTWWLWSGSNGRGFRCWSLHNAVELNEYFEQKALVAGVEERALDLSLLSPPLPHELVEMVELAEMVQRGGDVLIHVCAKAHEPCLIDSGTLAYSYSEAGATDSSSSDDAPPAAIAVV